MEARIPIELVSGTAVAQTNLDWARPMSDQMTASGVDGPPHNVISYDTSNQVDAVGTSLSGRSFLVHQQDNVGFQGSTAIHPLDKGIVALKDNCSHVKYDGLNCCAIGCRFGHEGSKPMRKDKLTQHIRDVHQGPDVRFQCFFAECNSDGLSLKDIIVHLQDVGLGNDVRFSALVAAADKPKCACGKGLVIHGRCKVCHVIRA